MSSKYGRGDNDDEMYAERKRDGPQSKGSYGKRGSYHNHKSDYPVIAMDIVNVSEKIIVPTKDYPKYNFLGKILGPKGSILKGVAASTKSKISILGRGSSKDLSMEEELSKSDNPDYHHLKEPLHVLIQVRGPKVEAHARMAAALKEMNKFMVPTYEKGMTGAPVMTPVVGSSVSGVPPVVPVGGLSIGAPMGAVPGAPILRYGIPPPGAIIIGQGGSIVGQHGIAPPIAPTSAPVSMDIPTGNTHNGPYVSPRQQGEKRTSDFNDYSAKKYRDETYRDSSYGSKHNSESAYNKSTDYQSRDNFSSTGSRASSTHSFRQGESNRQGDYH